MPRGIWGRCPAEFSVRPRRRGAHRELGLRQPRGIPRDAPAVRLLVAARGGEYCPPESLVSSCARLELSSAFDHVSASEVRTRIGNGEPWEHLVPAAVRRRVSEIYAAGKKRLPVTGD